MKIKSLILGFFIFSILIPILPSAMAANGGFSDVPISHQNHDAIIYLQNLGILQGYPDGTFKPNQSVNRVEALKIILLASGSNPPEATGTAGFRDTDPTAWYAKYLINALQLGIIQGYPDGNFKPAQTVNLVENLKILLLTKQVDLNQLINWSNPYADVDLNQWYVKYLQYAQAKNLIDADAQNKVFPAQAMTRGKLAEAIYRLLYIQKNNLNSYQKTANPIPVSNAAAINFSIDPTSQRQPISAYIYGTNGVIKTGSQNRESGIKLIRAGGNRWTTYNWENNASNAGADYGPNSSDSYLSQSDVPAEAVTSRINEAFSLGAAALITIPMVDYVAADKNGLVTDVASDSNPRWVKNLPITPNNKLPSNPDLQDQTVYQDQFVSYLQNLFQSELNKGNQLFFDLDNEPGLWSSTHPLVHPKATTYAEMAKRTADFALMIKIIAPNSLVFGSVAYGYSEFTSLQGAIDQNGRDYLDFFLDNAKSMEKNTGKRLIDVLDLHWYTEAQGNGVKVVNSQASNPSDAEIEARVQAPRSLWDNSYVENSWIANDVLGKQPIKLIPWLKEKIANHYPGTKLAFSEYNYGGGNHISGGIAEADTLGIFGREGVFAANLWPMNGVDYANSYIFGAFDLFLNYDGNGGSVGDVSVLAQNSNIASTSLYAFVKNNDPHTLYVIAINKTKNALAANLNFNNSAAFPSANIYQLTKNNSKPQSVGSVAIQNNQLSYQLPDLSVTLFVLH